MSRTIFYDSHLNILNLSILHHQLQDHIHIIVQGHLTLLPVVRVFHLLLVLYQQLVVEFLLLANIHWLSRKHVRLEAGIDSLSHPRHQGQDIEPLPFTEGLVGEKLCEMLVQVGCAPQDDSRVSACWLWRLLAGIDGIVDVHASKVPAVNSLQGLGRSIDASLSKFRGSLLPLSARSGMCFVRSGRGRVAGSRVCGESMWHSARCVHVSHEINAEAADSRENPHAGDDEGNLEPLPAEEKQRALSSAFGRVARAAGLSRSWACFHR